MDKTLGAAATIVILIFLYLFQLGGGELDDKIASENDVTTLENTYRSSDLNDPDSNGGQQPSAPAAGSQNPNASGTVTVGSFNIQKLGTSKMRNKDVTNILVDIIRKFDVLAIQEVTSVDQEIIPRLKELVNADGHRYNFILGPREGSTIYKEQYLFFFNTNTIEFIPNATVVRDPRNIVERDPLAAQFRCRVANGRQGFSFTLLNIHTSPTKKELVPELESMYAMMPNLFAAFPQEDDFIILGDLNCPPRFFQDFAFLPNQYPLIRDEWATNTRGKRNMDNMIIDARRTAEFQRQSGVLNVLTDYQLSLEQANQVSDHMPIWAVFSNVEQDPVAVTQKPNVIR